jgi:O-antigen ligase
MILSVTTVGVATVMGRADLGGQMVGDASSENRLVQWRACVVMMLKNPVLGVGPGESAYVMRDYGGIQGLAPHNTLLQVFAETGIPGGIFFFLFACYPIWVAMKKLKNRRDSVHDPAWSIYKYLTIALLGFWACAIFSNRVQFAILYVLIALMVALEENILNKEFTGNVSS